MPDKDDHLAQANHNTQFYLSFDRQNYSDWAATVLFYAGLHYIDAFLATHQINPGSHDVRDKYVNQLRELRHISGHYFALKNSSRTARYSPLARFQAKHLTDLEQIHLEQIKSALRPHLSS